MHRSAAYRSRRKHGSSDLFARAHNVIMGTWFGAWLFVQIRGATLLRSIVQPHHPAQQSVGILTCQCRRWLSKDSTDPRETFKHFGTLRRARENLVRAVACAYKAVPIIIYIKCCVAIVSFLFARRARLLWD